ncbi:MAG: hypothetical protein ACI9RZ_002438 [Sphingobacteriales bacterium]|jgi:hypothetical protein
MIINFIAVYLCLKSKITAFTPKNSINIFDYHPRLSPSIITLEIIGVRIGYWLFIVREKMPALNMKPIKY